MLRRVSFGLFKGTFLGIVLAGVLIQGAGWMSLTSLWLAYPVCLVLGVMTGLVAGKPVWARGAQVEAGLKAFAGAALACLGMFLLRRYTPMEVDLSAWGLGRGPLSELPITSLPLLGAGLAMLFELDNTEGPAQSQSKGATPKGATRASAKRVRSEHSHSANAASEGEEELRTEPGQKARR